MQPHMAMPLQCFQRGDRAHQFHAVVGGVRLAAEQLTFRAFAAQQRAPSAHAWIALAGAIGKNFNCILRFFAHCGSVSLRWVILLFNLGAAGNNLLTSPSFHFGLISRMPCTRLIACTKYTPPLTAHQRSPAASMKENRSSHLV